MLLKKIIKGTLITSIATTLHGQPILRQLTQQRLGLKSNIEYSDSYLQQLQNAYTNSHHISRNLVKALQNARFTLKDLEELSAHPPLMKTVRRIRLISVGRIEIPSWIIKLSHLEKLDLSFKPNIDLSTTLFPPSLKKINLSYCNLKKLPASISLLPNLRELDLAGNQDIDLTDTVLPPFLESLSLRGCKLLEIPRSLADLPYLKRLNVSGNIMIKLSPLPSSLTEINITYCGLPSIPPSCVHISNVINDPLSH